MFLPIIAPHGITDLIDAPVQSLVVYGALTPLVYPLPLPVKTGLLLAVSMYHMRHDIPGGPIAITLMHLAWVNHPWMAYTYLSLHPCTATLSAKSMATYKSKKGGDCPHDHGDDCRWFF